MDKVSTIDTLVWQAREEQQLVISAGSDYMPDFAVGDPTMEFIQVRSPSLRASKSKSGCSVAVVLKPQHFNALEPTGANMSLIVNAELGILNGEYEVGVFIESGLCVGSTGISAGQTAAEGGATVGLAIWADDPTTEAIDGAVEGEALYFRIWDCVEEMQARVTWLEGDRTYQSDGFAQIRIDGATSMIPTELALEEPFPNPFNSITTIRYSLPNASSIKLNVFDLSGRETATLASGNKLAGFHNVVWSAEGVGSGLYFVRLESGVKTMTQKVLLVK